MNCKVCGHEMLLKWWSPVSLKYGKKQAVASYYCELCDIIVTHRVPLATIQQDDDDEKVLPKE